MLPENWKELTYPQLNLDDHTLDKNLPECATPLQRKPAERSAGVLETLSLELLHLILAQLDLISILNVRYVNKRCSDLTDSLPELQAIARYGQNALRGSLAINTAAAITVEKLHQQLFKKSCEKCGDFAPYLYLITCARVCFLCLSNADQYCPLGIDLIKRKYGLNYSIIQSLPHMKCLPGVYSPGGCKVSRAVVLYDAWSALQAAVTYHGSRDNLKTYIEKSHAESMTAYHRRTQEATEANLRLPRLRKPASLSPYDRKSANPRRFVAVIELPVINKSSKVVDWGFYCKACRNANEWPRDWRVRYDEETFEQHLLACGRIENGIHQASTDPDDISEFRLLVDHQHIKYVTIDPYIFDDMDLIFEPTLINILRPLLPAGDWNQARIFQAPSSEKSSNGDVEMQVETSTQMLPGIRGIWHSLQIDYLELEIGSRLRSNVYEATSSNFPGQFVVKFARFGYEITRLERETTAYKWIDGHKIGPNFLGHLTEHGRVIGFAMSKIENARHATLDDINICRQALRRLHTLGIKHGDTNKHNFLIHPHGVTLIDFDFADQNATGAELNKELHGLGQEFADTTGKGGVGDLIDGTDY
ncbi:uncharacterized protein K460DRAFT_282437 [Cucurbitaria berberidis CBS 394.84]|uniref:F-box domain-containing protein n=1 Tax=Cucurbitaria berberidis CBS 394.84 TaxID=1168544 RepID=A0A9P4GI72_9PLEO|nr:uncharacterized protein K460DRAFT_282437 [Cucurbitaria berberidis CBS 394.84]KAF1845757.1 hypothetical protein K460DRAFT_282437 [Cucurbitaria berberidis CBS 394.84]